MSVVACTKTRGTKHLYKLILNMFSVKAKTRKTFGFPRSRARSHGALPLVHDSHINRQNSMRIFALRVHYIINSAKMKCFLMNSVDSTKMNC